jgi:hypothetical protein
MSGATQSRVCSAQSESVNLGAGVRFGTVESVGSMLYLQLTRGLTSGNPACLGV